MSQLDWNETPCAREEPDFGNLLAVLERRRPARPTLFEFFLNGELHRRLAGDKFAGGKDPLDPYREAALAFRNAGYDYLTVLVPGFWFQTGHVEQKSSRSLNAGALVSDRASFKSYPWPDVDALDFGFLDRLGAELHRGMKLIVYCPNGILENVINIVGFENLCFMIHDDEKLVVDLFEAVGSRLVRHVELCVRHDSVGAVIGNDDWGFKTQTMLKTEDMRRFVFPWHKRLVAAAHAAGRPAILHSCGNLAPVMDDIIADIGYDAKHSYEDAILPVEEAYERYGRRIAILGGIDVDFVCRSAPEKVYERSRAMLDRTRERGGYALGTGNSVPGYVPQDHYFAMIRAALDMR